MGFIDGALFDEIQLLGRLTLGEADLVAATTLLEAVLTEARGLSLHGTALEAAIHLAGCPSRGWLPLRGAVGPGRG